LLVVRTLLHFLRRTHLYAGLLMLPWAVLYGATAFLFNHPTAFSDQPFVSFGRDALADTPMADAPKPAAVADQVVAALRARNPSSSFTLVEADQARYTREFAFAVVRAEGREVNVLIDSSGAGGRVRSHEVSPPKVEEPAPFDIGRANVSRPPPTARPAPTDGLVVPDPLHERIKAAVPTVVERTGFPGGEVTVTSVPDLSFLMDADGRRWRVTFNAMTGAVAGRPADADEPPPAPSTRNFLLRLHTAHGYPYGPGPRSAWAVLVDAMAVVLVFWGLTGLVMWWQVKAVRRSGAVVLVLSATAAVVLVVLMRNAMASGVP
jgi:hypothetical protein